MAGAPCHPAAIDRGIALTTAAAGVILPEAMTPARELKRRRAAMGLTQVQLAESLGVTWSTVARWETGQRQIPAMAFKLLDCLAGKNRPAKARKRS
jgi:DNA-binding transcriptional regulator YiaG